MRCSLNLLALALLTCTTFLVSGEDVLIDIGNVRPEGIYMVSGNEIGLDEGSTYALASQTFHGGIDAWNVKTGEKTNVVPSVTYAERAMLGMWYDNGYILVAGGGPAVPALDSVTPALHVFEAATGSLLGSCFPLGGGGFMNDVATIDGYAYATDSFTNKLMVLELEPAIRGECNVSSIELPEAVFANQEGFAANGIVPYKNGLLIGQSDSGGLYYLDLQDNNAVSEVLPSGTMPSGDGLTIADGNVLYVTENAIPRISVWELAPSVIDDTMSEPTILPPVQATLLGYLTSAEYDSPSSSGVYEGIIYSVNQRASIGIPAEGEEDLSTFNETFQIVGVKRDTIGVIDVGLDDDNPGGILMVSGNQIGLVEGTYALVSQSFYGGIDAWNVETGEKTIVVPSIDYVGFSERGMFGMWYDDGYILVAGGGAISAMHSQLVALHVFEAATGSLLASCLPLGVGSYGNFLANVATIGGFAYVTNGLDSKVMVVELEPATRGVCVVSSIELPEAIFDGFFTTDGIVPYKGGLLINQPSDGGLYYLDLQDNSVSEVLSPGTMPKVNTRAGMTIADGNILYVIENRSSKRKIGVWELAMAAPVQATLLGYLTQQGNSDLLLASAVAGDIIYSINKRERLLPTKDGYTNTFQIVAINRDKANLDPTTTSPPTDTTPAPTPLPSLASDTSSVVWCSSVLSSALAFISGLWIMMM